MLKRTVFGITLTLLLIGMLTLAFNIQPAKTQSEGELLFFDDFDDGVADGWTPQRGYTWEVIDGQYVSSHGLGKSISIIDDLTFSDEVTMWNRK